MANLLKRIFGTTSEKEVKKLEPIVRKIDALEEEGKAFVIRPRKPVTVSRIEKDVEKLSALYHEGRRDAEFAYQDLLAFLG